MEQTFFLDTPIGQLEIVASQTAVTAIRFCGKPEVATARENGPANNSTAPLTAGNNAPSLLLMQAAEELSEYFAGTRQSFSFAVSPAGTEFQLSVWRALQEIPYGQTRTYKQIAETVGRPAACRAVGMANNRNPIPIVIPCHRVVGSGGQLVGYAGGLDVKTALLELER